MRTDTRAHTLVVGTLTHTHTHVRETGFPKRTRLMSRRRRRAL